MSILEYYVNNNSIGVVSDQIIYCTHQKGKNLQKTEVNTAPEFHLHLSTINQFSPWTSSTDVGIYIYIRICKPLYSC